MRPLRWLARHPLVWLVPLTLWSVLGGWLCWTIARTPLDPHVYDL